MNISVDLDQLVQEKSADPGDMLGALKGLPEQCRRAVEIGREAAVHFPDIFQNAIITGLGGSAIGGDFLRALAGKSCRIPLTVNRDYQLPSFVNEKTLVFAVSYSGNTEETLGAYDDAKRKGAMLIALTSGGQLAERARRDGVPLISIPAGLQPRAAAGYLFLPTLVLMGSLNLMTCPEPDYADLFQSLDGMGSRLEPGIPEKDNPAKQLAKVFFNKIPVIWGASGTTETVAMRWKGQINENSKALAYFNVLPELNHNEIVGTEAPQQFLKDVELVILRDREDHPRVQKRVEITKEIIGERVSGITEIWGEGSSLLSRMFTLTYIGDYTSAYLALLYGIDPSPVKLITLLKNRMAE